MQAMGKTLSGESIDSVIKEDLLKINITGEESLNIWQQENISKNYRTYSNKDFSQKVLLYIYVSMGQGYIPKMSREEI